MLQFRFKLLGLIGLLSAILLVWPIAVSAQTFVCPNGPGPGEVQVGTTGGSHGVAAIPICASDGRSNSSEEAEERVVWEKRWGAIAAGGNGWGAVTDMRTEKQAKKAALAQCVQTDDRNAKKCRAHAYYNQCAVVVLPDDAGGYFFQSAVDLRTAESLGMRSCRAEHAQCSVFYSGCSYARRIN